MKLTESLPQFLVVNGRKVQCDFDFRNVLRFMDFLQDDNLMPDARVYLAAKCIVKGRVREPEKIVIEAKKVLFPPAKRTGGKRLTSFDQDASYIRSAFRQVYGINLWTARMHWIEFRELLDGLTEGNKYTEVIGIRARKVPTPNKYNHDEIEWLMQAKAAYSLEMTEEEQQAQYEKDVQNIFSVLSRYAGVNENG